MRAVPHRERGAARDDRRLRHEHGARERRRSGQHAHVIVRGARGEPIERPLVDAGRDQHAIRIAQCAPASRSRALPGPPHRPRRSCPRRTSPCGRRSRRGVGARSCSRPDRSGSLRCPEARSSRDRPRRSRAPCDPQARCRRTRSRSRRPSRPSLHHATRASLPRMAIQRSQAIFERAKQVIPGGVNSPVRACRSVGADPVFVAQGDGATITDVDGNRYIDLIGSWGPLILGHAHPRDPRRDRRGDGRRAPRSARRPRSRSGSPRRSATRIRRWRWCARCRRAPRRR